MRKRYRLHLQGREHLDRWLISYADYMTLIFALFVVLYSAALVNKDKYRAVIDGMSQAFSVVPVHSDSLLDGQSNVLFDPVGPVSSSLSHGVSPPASQAPISNVPMLQDGTSLAQLEVQLQQNLAALLDAGVVKLTRDEHWLAIELSSGLLFSSGSAFLGSNATPVINTLSGILKPVDNYVRVRGYTDNQQINNELYRSNWALSAARAEAVLTRLIAEGIAPPRLAFEAYGEFSPVADNRSEQGRLQNRKVVVAISRFAWRAPAPIVANPKKSDPVAAPQQTVDTAEIKVITLPGGGIRITTRQG